MKKAQVNLIFFDQDTAEGIEKINGYKRAMKDSADLAYGIHFVNQDVKELLQELDVQIIVSPANSLGFMDGGIDLVYMQLFPDIQKRVQEAIASFNIETALGRKVLPIGSCKLVKTLDEKTPLLACVPTMFLPENITKTRNVYWAMRALLLCCERLRTRHWPNDRINVAVPCFGTGVGQMTGFEAGKQVSEALHDHQADPEGAKYLPNGLHFKTKAGDPNVVLSAMACKQPTNYANTEIDSDVKAEDLVKRIECRSYSMGIQ